jgi:hypothetical protein
MKLLLTLICVTVLGGVSLAFGPSQTQAAERPTCRKNPDSAPRGYVPVFVRVLATIGINPDMSYGTTVKWYRAVRKDGRITNAIVKVNRIDSGCWRVVLFKKRHVPKWGCVTVRHGWVAPGGACQPVTKDQSGNRQATFHVTRS